MTTRRQLDGQPRPLPGCSPEFWPMDWRTYSGSDAYGWGATTTNLLIRHLFGFKESRQTDGWVAELTPALPANMLEQGGRYGLRNLSYRGLHFDVWYVQEPDDLYVQLDLGAEARECSVHELTDRPERIYVSGAPGSSRHRFAVRLGHRYSLRLR
jgi:hypothetical protein